MEKSLKQLKTIGDGANEQQIGTIVRGHILPFVVAFAEAIRFKWVALLVAEQFTTDDGKLDLAKNVVQQSGVVPQKQDRVGKLIVRNDEPFDIDWLLHQWGKLSDNAKILYVDGKPHAPYLEEGGIRLNLGKNPLNELLSVANGQAFPTSTRLKRDIQQWIHPQVVSQTLANHAYDRIGVEGDLQGSPNPNQISTVSYQLDMVGSLHLITMGILYLSGHKLKPAMHKKLKESPQNWWRRSTALPMWIRTLKKI